MKKALIIALISLLYIVIIILSFKVNSFYKEINTIREYSYSKEYVEFSLKDITYEANDDILIIPSYSVYVESCCDTLITFASLKSVEVLEMEVEDILNNYYTKIYEEDWEHYGEIYYSEEYDYRILSYSIEEGQIMNYVHYLYTQ